MGHVNEIINVNEGPWRKATPKGSGSLPTPRSGFAADVIPWDIVLCNVKYKWNRDSCDSYLHVIMTLRPAALHSCPYGLILSFSLSQPASYIYGWLLATLVFNYASAGDCNDPGEGGQEGRRGVGEEMGRGAMGIGRWRGKKQGGRDRDWETGRGRSSGKAGSGEGETGRVRLGGGNGEGEGGNGKGEK